MKKKRRPSFQRPRYPYAAVPTHQTKPSDAPGQPEVPEVQRKPRCGPYVVEWQLEDTLCTNKPAYSR